MLDKKMKSFKQFINEKKFPNQDPKSTRPKVKSVEDNLAWGNKPDPAVKKPAVKPCGDVTDATVPGEI